MTKNVSIFRLSNKMFRNFIGKMMKLIFTAAGFPKVHIVCEPRRGKTWEVALSKIQMMSAGCLLTLPCQALRSGLWSYVDISFKSLNSLQGSIPTLEMGKLKS